MFEFIADDDLRTSLQSDSAELKKCFDAGAWKAVHVLAGSIVEAVLVDQVSAVPESKRPADIGDPLKANLGQLIVTGKQLGILSDRTAHLAEALRSYRNLIHAGRAVRLGDAPTSAGAKVAQALVDMVVADVGKASEKRGLTADQLILKLQRDSGVDLVLTTLLDEMKTGEIEKLLVARIPAAYMDEEFPWSTDGEDYEILRVCFHKAFERASRQAKERVLATYVRMIREDTGPRLTEYERAFFRATYLEFIPGEEDKALVKRRLLGLIDKDPEHARITVAGIGNWLTQKEAETATVSAINHLVFRAHHSSAARSILREIYIERHKPAVAGIIKARMVAYEKRNVADRVRMFQELLENLNSGGEDYDFEDIPF